MFPIQPLHTIVTTSGNSTIRQAEACINGCRCSACTRDKPMQADRSNSYWRTPNKIAGFCWLATLASTAPLVEGGRIAIKSDFHDNWLRMVISNSGRRESERQTNAGNGIGQSNTAARLETLYGRNHKFWMEWPEAGGCRVTVELPFRPTVRKQEA